LEHGVYAYTIDSRSDFHFGESERVMLAEPEAPVDAVSVRSVTASEILTVQVSIMTSTVPPGTFKHHGTGFVVAIVVLITCTELAAHMISHSITFTQQMIYQLFH